MSLVMRVALVAAAGLIAGARPGAVAAGASGIERQAQPLTVRADSRFELLTIIFRLAGAEEYNMCLLPRYEADIDASFARFKDHPAIALAREIRARHGISFDAIPHFAIAITPPPDLAGRVTFGADGKGLGDARWHGPHAEQVLEAVRTFSRDTDFPAFFAAHQPLYAATERRLEAFVRKGIALDWYGRFFGEPPGAEFIVTPGMCNGGANFGPRFRPPNGAEELYAFLGVTASDAEGIPLFPDSLLPTLVHEFAHSFVNPFVERHLASLAPAAERLFPHVSAVMTRQGYGKAETVLTESLVRATVIRYLRANADEARVARDISEQLRRGFVWIEDLDRLLDEYEQHRDRMPRFDLFAPRVVSFFEDVSASIQARIQALDARRPAVVASMPADGATDVDPALERLSVTFDRPMAPDVSMNPGPGGKPTYPEISAAAFETDRRTLVARIRLKPSTSYEILLSGTGFRSADGVPLTNRVIRFRTRER